MADFVLLYSGGKMPETEEEQAQVTKAWTDWYGNIGSDLKDGGNPFAPQAKTVGNDGSITDGAKGTPHTGYTIVSAASLDAATDVAKGSPVLEGGGTITDYEILEMM